MPVAPPPSDAPTVGEVGLLVGGSAFGLLTMSSLALALFGVHRGWLAVLLAAVVVAVGGLVVLRTTSGRPRVDRTELVVAAVLVAVTAALVLPGFAYGAKFRDPGVYVGHAFAIEREHATSFADPAFATDQPVEVREDNQLPVLVTPTGDLDLHCCDTFQAMKADPEADDRIVPSFFHAWPSVLATALGVGGRVGLFNTGPVLAILSVLTVFVAVRRGVSTLAAVLASGLLAVNMMQVWQARYPTTEMATQSFFTLGVLAVVVGVQFRSRWAFGVAGLAAGSMFLVRPDGLLLVLAVVGVAALLHAVERATWAIAPLLGGLAVVAPLAVYQAYDRTAGYTEGKIPSLPVVAALVALLAVGAHLGRLLRRRRPGLEAWGQRRPPQEWAKLVAVLVVVGLGAFFVVAALRPALWGETMGVGKSGEVVRKYDEDNLRRLTWFLTPAAIPLAVAGAGLLLVRGRAVALSGLLLPGLLLTPLFVWEPRIAPQLMWWTRRYVPVVLVFLLVAAAVTLAWLLAVKGRWRPVAAAAGVALTVWMGGVGLSQSLELRGHNEMSDSLAVIDGLAGVAADQPSVFVWIQPDVNTRRYVAPMTTHHGHPSLAVEQGDAATIDILASAYPDRQLLVVAPTPELADLDLAPSHEVQAVVERWEDDSEARPDAAVEQLVRFWVYRP